MAYKEDKANIGPCKTDRQDMLTVRSENNQSQKHGDDIRRNENILKIFPLDS